MKRPRIRQIARQFPENGLKLLLHHPANVRDLFGLVRAALVDQLDFERMKLVRTTFVGRDYRHVESDLVLTVPFRRRGSGRSPHTVLLYILIEHQSEPDRLMVLRVLDYLVQIWKGQVRDWGRQHASLAGVQLQPIVPVVFYTGTTAWPRLEGLAELIERGELFLDVTPAVHPVFVNLPELPAEQLESAGGYFGWLLELVQQRRQRRERFQQLLGRVVQHLESMPPAERLRWLELLSYVHALVYHEREAVEHAGLHQTIEDAVQKDPPRQEVKKMRRTMAQVLEEKGRQKGRKEEAVRSRQQTLLRQLRRRFGEVSPTVQQTIEATKDIAHLDAWLDQVVTARSWENMDIGPTV